MSSRVQARTFRILKIPDSELFCNFWFKVLRKIRNSFLPVRHSPCPSRQRERKQRASRDIRRGNDGRSAWCGTRWGACSPRPCKGLIACRSEERQPTREPHCGTWRCRRWPACLQQSPNDTPRCCPWSGWSCSSRGMRWTIWKAAYKNSLLKYI